MFLLLAGALTACQTTTDASGGSGETTRVVNAWRICKANFRGAQAQSVYDACTRVIEEAKGPFWTASGYNNRALVLRYWGRHEEELDDLNNAIRVDPDHSAAHNNRGRSFSRMGDLDKAGADFQTAIRLEPDNELALNNYAWHLAGLGDYEAAWPAIKKAVALDPESSILVDTEAHVLMGLGEVASAEAAFDKAMELGGVAVVRQFQEALAAKGYAPGRQDGVLDEASRAALSACIRDNCRLMLD